MGPSYGPLPAFTRSEVWALVWQVIYNIGMKKIPNQGPLLVTKVSSSKTTM